MNSVILCEGLDDVLILGYFIHKVSGGLKWIYNNNATISDNFTFPLKNKKRENQEVYTRENDKLFIWCVGGKDSFDFSIKTIYKFNTNFPNERFEEILIFSDRDKDEISTAIMKIQDLFKSNGWVMQLSNNKQNPFQYEVDGEEYKVNISPIIIPFEIEGALETVLMTGIADTCEEDRFVVDSAKKYIKEVTESDKIATYLKRDRLKLKAEFSAVISIINPDRSTSSFDKLLMSQNWEEKTEVKRHFELLERIFK